VKVGGYTPFTDPDVGKTVGFKIVGEQESTDYIGHRFIDREYEIEDKFLIQANEHPLDSLLHLPEYPEVQAALFGFGVKAEEKEEVKDTSKAQQDLPLPSEDTPASNIPKENIADDAPAITCPGGGKFGVDIDQLKECGECGKYEECSAEETRLADARKAARAEKKLNRKA